MSDMNHKQVLQEEYVPIQLQTHLMLADKINPKHVVFVILTVTITHSHSSWSAFAQELQELGFRRSSRNTFAEVSGIFQAATTSNSTAQHKLQQLQNL